MTWLRTLALLAVPRDWRETVRADLAADLARDDARRLSTGRYVVEAIRVGARLRWREKRLPAPVSLLSGLARLPFELRLAVRSLRRAPWFAATVVGVMTLVLTLATTVFAIVDGVLFRPLPYPESERLFVVEAGFKTGATEYAGGASAADLASWSAAAPGVVFSGFSAGSYIGYGTGVNDYTGGVAHVRPDIFDVLGVRPMIGGFSSEHFEERTPLTPVIITWDLWQSRFDGRADIVGHAAIVDRARQTGFHVVGVMPRGFVFPTDRAEVQFLMPSVLAPEMRTDPRRRSFGTVLARAHAGMSAEALRSRVEIGMQATAAGFPDLGARPDGVSDDYWRSRGPYDRASVTRLSSSVGQRSRPLFQAVLAAILALVALGALNASGLMAARTLDRRRELAVRRALGASRLALGRLVMVEALLLIVPAALVAVTLARPALGFALALLPEQIVLLKPWGAEVLGWRTVAFAALAAIAIAVPTSVWPMRRSATVAPCAGPGLRVSDGKTTGRFVVVSCQVAGALALTVVGALLVTSLLSVYARPLPLQTDDVVLIEAEMEGPDAFDDSVRNARVQAMIDRLRRLPGVRHTAVISGQVLQGPWPSVIADYGFHRPATATQSTTFTSAVTADYYRIVQPRLLAGRLPTEAELAADAPVILVSQHVAASYWPGEDAVGQILSSARGRTPHTVIGIVEDVPWGSWDTAVGTLYGPYARLSRRPTVTLLVEVRGESARATENVLRELAAITPPIAARRAGDLIDVFADTVRARRFRSWLFGGFAVAALVVVGVGILGLLAMSTARRTREVGIRQALGATPGSIVRLFVREQMRPVLAGLAIGAIVSAWVVGFVESYLFGVTTTDPRVWGTAVILILVTAGAGALIPSMRASTTDPTIALRAE